MQTVTNFEVLRKNQVEPIAIFVKDPRNEDLTDVVGSTNTFTMINILDDSTVLSGTFSSGGSSLPPVIDHPSTGVYQYSLNAATYTGEYLLSFKCVLPNEIITENMFVKSVTARYFKYAAILRNQVDKARKSVVDYIENMDTTSNDPAVRLFFGYDDSHMIFYLERGVQILNAISPYTSFTVDTFPFDTYGAVLIDAATIAALEAQAVFAIDTDYNYSLGGNSLVIEHHGKLSSTIDELLRRFDKSAITWKQQYRTKGTVLWQWSPGGARTARTLNSMPSGIWSRMLSSIY